MVHTISGIVLHRLQRMVNSGDTPHEARVVVGEMVRLVKEWDPYFFEKVGLGPLAGDSLPETDFPRVQGSGDRYAADFDGRLNGRWSRLREASAEAEAIVAESVRSIFALTPDQ